jgi:hypothetical protein
VPAVNSEYDGRTSNPIDHSVLVGDSPGPGSSHVVLKGLRFANSTAEGIGHDFLDDPHDSERGTRMGFDPVRQVAPELTKQNRLPL